MALVDLIDVVKKFGSNTVLDGVNFSLSSGERVAIIGKNGGGKSTLMKIIAGEYEIDGGRVITQNGINIQMLEQSPKFDDNLSVKDALKRELKEIYDAIDEYNQILEQISNDPQNEALLTRQNELNKFIDAKDGWNIDNKIERIFAQLYKNSH